MRPLSLTDSSSSTTSPPCNWKSYIILPDVKEVSAHLFGIKHVPPDYVATGQETEIGCIGNVLLFSGHPNGHLLTTIKVPEMHAYTAFVAGHQSIMAHRLITPYKWKKRCFFLFLVTSA
ncbi:hypothetical protein I307_04585 [Cryptococcus deuterogattii 99/473]|uniref:Uncharacterized protein n=1 Tax=Cryptococcus deuterogattii Ram5 TaxID=1296110 RepID=A0A0D0U1F5_9TREE|nr:hypothetical protein I309_03308 [Cryptococcus deuterogattii LA55]KIR42028.1 hypothetical protein I313_02190 [Cryptococcus deuterogattii Ram5]KIR73148.1 hypothetical protein I310_02812 [Cryptococcus deuterogattii CA1014]KIR90075.1 hypothetical protein I304_06007 [Cryptococcus deuterogattii CBS 10090]KIR98903.1 hypothetical protein L804_03523 [Cryptococcus deuterogattii 2001/935-1]KIY55923.1 hypothetical protein I307_04585 [Cryptococcus deuterogattii 99/473]